MKNLKLFARLFLSALAIVYTCTHFTLITLFLCIAFITFVRWILAEPFKSFNTMLMNEKNKFYEFLKN